MKVATWNIRVNGEKMDKLQTKLLKRKIDFVIITETKKKTKNRKT